MLKLVAIGKQLCILLNLAILLGGCTVLVDACCLPNQYECIMGMTNTTVKGGELDVSTTGWMYSLDFDNKKVAFTGQNFRLVQDYNKMMQYLFSEGYCIPSKLSAPMENCFPANASIMSMEMGGPKGVMLDVYDIGKLWPDIGFTLTLYINRDGCIPFSETLRTKGFFATFGFLNITLGIKDPSVFDVPSPPCPKDTENIVTLLQEKAALPWPLPPSLL